MDATDLQICEMTCCCVCAISSASSRACAIWADAVRRPFKPVFGTYVAVDYIALQCVCVCCSGLHCVAVCVCVL